MLNDLRDTFGYKIPEIFGRSFSPEYQRVYDAFITKPPSSVARDHDIMVRGMVKDGDWQTKDIFYITAAQNAADSLWNWINPGTHDLTVVNLVAGQFTVYRGWTGNGVNGYLDTNYNPNTDGINFVLDDASFGVYITTNQVAGNIYELGVFDGTYWSYLLTRIVGDEAKIRINNSSASSGANANAIGFYIANRVLNTHQDLYKNKVRIINGAINSTGVPNHDIYLLSLNNNGAPAAFSSKQIAEAHAGGGQTQTNVNNFTDRLETFMDSIGAGLI